ncbi:uncharacterized protein LOC119071294 isoform X1 [Bradysia coprophila]|uniref:uncharacterized protein LOC119071294 isoform X1 n=1 Tax=Bradysia coprophila TaxID=38358 RepID=UPI00187DD30F|nr:uncharacterized protein LOC119071294 isoform X1 [Bradysia coprophila]
MNHLSLIALICFAVVLVNASVKNTTKITMTMLSTIKHMQSGYYVPKGYYVIHADGHQSELSKISPSHELLLRSLRRRRSAQFSSSSSSSSSSVSSNGGPISFHQSSSSIVSPGGSSSQGYYPAVFGSINNRFNGDDDDDYYDDGQFPINNNQPQYSSSQIHTGTFAGNGYNAPIFTSSQTQTGGVFPNRINTPSSGGVNYNNGNTFVSQTSSVSHPSPNGNVVFTQSNNNGVHSETSGIVYPNGQVQITSHKTGKF